MEDTSIDLSTSEKIKDFVASSVEEAVSEIKLTMKKQRTAFHDIIMPFSNRIAELERKGENNESVSEQGDVEELREDIEELRSTLKYFKTYVNEKMGTILEIPGIIGETGRFREFKHFVLYAEKTFRDCEESNNKTKKAVKTVQTALDQSSFQIAQLGKKIEKSCKEMVELSTKSLVSEVNSKLEIIKKDVFEVRAEKLAGLEQMRANAERIMGEFDKINQFDEKLQSDFKLNREEILKLNANTEAKFSRMKAEFKDIQSKFVEIAGFIKDVRFRKNLNDGEVGKKELTEVSSKLKGKKSGVISKDNIEEQPLKRVVTGGSLSKREKSVDTSDALVKRESRKIVEGQKSESKRSEARKVNEKREISEVKVYRDKSEEAVPQLDRVNSKEKMNPEMLRASKRAKRGMISLMRRVKGKSNVEKQADLRQKKRNEDIFSKNELSKTAKKRKENQVEFTFPDEKEVSEGKEAVQEYKNVETPTKSIRSTVKGTSTVQTLNTLGKSKEVLLEPINRPFSKQSNPQMNTISNFQVHKHSKRNEKSRPLSINEDRVRFRFSSVDETGRFPSNIHISESINRFKLNAQCFIKKQEN